MGASLNLSSKHYAQFVSNPFNIQDSLTIFFLYFIFSADKLIDSDISPKPIIFLPSVAETNLVKGGTYLCLLEKFFPDIIKVYWKEKDDDIILESQEGNTIRTNDRYMIFSWLTVTEDSIDKEHRCIVKHENNKGGVDQEILFPPIDKGMCKLRYIQLFICKGNSPVVIVCIYKNKAWIFLQSYNIISTEPCCSVPENATGGQN